MSSWKPDVPLSPRHVLLPVNEGDEVTEDVLASVSQIRYGSRTVKLAGGSTVKVDQVFAKRLTDCSDQAGFGR